MKRMAFFLLILLTAVLAGGGLVKAGTTPLFTLKKKVYVGKKNYTFTCQPVIYGDRVYHATNGDNDGADKYDYLYAFDARGNLLWKFRSPDGGNTNINGVAVGKDYVLVSADNGYVYALSHTGKLLWKFKTGGKPKGCSLYDLNGDGVEDALVGSLDDYIYTLSGQDGRLLWKFKTGCWVLSFPALGDINADGKVEVVVGSDDFYIYTLSGQDGKLL